jgi:hypothetical protein
MIISWFSQPEGSLSSYYQYDTVTTNFTRIRMELGRASSNGSTDDTFIGFKTERYVGFSDQTYSTRKSNLGHWSVNEDNELCYDDVPLAGGHPAPGARIYDCTSPSSFVHRGNPVADGAPTLPDGIAAKHLALLANETFGGSSDTTTKLTGSDATDAELSTALKKAVCDVLEVDDFATITDEQILAKLTSQAAEIRVRAVAAKETSLSEALTEAGKATDLMSEELTDGDITPNTELTTAFGSLQDAIAKAQAAETSGVHAALVEVSKAQEAVVAAIKTIDVTHREAVETSFSAADDALAVVHLQEFEMQTAEKAYEKLTEAADVGDYQKELFEGTEFEGPEVVL